MSFQSNAWTSPQNSWLLCYDGEIQVMGKSTDLRKITPRREVYENAYLYHKHTKEWYRCDLTPVLLADVPKELRLRVLILS